MSTPISPADTAASSRPDATAQEKSSGRIQLNHYTLAILLIFSGLVLCNIANLLVPGWHSILLYLEILLVACGLFVSIKLILCVRTELLQPLDMLRSWANEMREGNLSTRIEDKEAGTQFQGLADDINALGDSLQHLSQHMDEEVQRKTRELEQKNHSLRVLYDVVASLNASQDLKDLLTRFLNNMQKIIHAEAGTVRLLNDDGQMELVASIGLQEDKLAQELIYPVQRCLCDGMIQDDEIRIQRDLKPSKHFIGKPLCNSDQLEMIAVPLEYRGKNLGVYNLFIEHETFEENEEIRELLTSVGRHLGMAIEKSRLDNEAKRISILQERNALAHELHDSLAQTLASLRFQVSMLDETLDMEGSDATHQEIAQIKGGLDEAYTELRELLAHFRAPFSERGLLPALEDQISNFRKQTGMHVLLQKEWDNAGLPANLELQVLRIIQEALANIRKHSQAHTVRVMLRCEDKEYTILIEDDGIGLDKPAFSGHPGEHLGLSIMEERARFLGGELRIESDDDEGTSILLTFHYPDTREDKQMQHYALI